ncbi:MAG: hypothetical protein ABJN26_01020 [Stappiaceae bacterium]
MAEDFSLYVVGPTGNGAAEATKLNAWEVPEAVAEGLGEGLLGEQTISADNLKKSWEKTHTVLLSMIEDAETDPDRSFRLEEMDVSLAVSGKGYIGFASAKAAAGIKLKFKRC